jgi:hypothetical protein
MMPRMELKRTSSECSFSPREASPTGLFISSSHLLACKDNVESIWLIDVMAG